MVDRLPEQINKEIQDSIAGMNGVCDLAMGGQTQRYRQEMDAYWKGFVSDPKARAAVKLAIEYFALRDRHQALTFAKGIRESLEETPALRTIRERRLKEEPSNG